VIVQHDLSVRVRYQETDAMGRVHHANYINYFELGRTELLRTAGSSYKQVEEEGFYLVIAEVSCRYLAFARRQDRARLPNLSRAGVVGDRSHRCGVRG
jgi:acyl-CoA thioester hydrolase